MIDTHAYSCQFRMPNPDWNWNFSVLLNAHFIMKMKMIVKKTQKNPWLKMDEAEPKFSE